MKTSSHSDFNEIVNCAHCGSCKSLCPTYAENSTEMMSARGRVALLQRFGKAELKASDKLYESVFSCLLCEACNKTCPMGINIANAIYEGRKNLRGFGKKRLFFDYLLRYALENPAISFKLLKVLRLLSYTPYAYKLPLLGYLKRLGIEEADAPFRGKVSVFRAERSLGRIAIFTGCLVNFIYPSYGRALLRVLNAIGYDVILPAGEICCGAPLLESGMDEGAKRMADINLQTFKNLNVEAVIALCPTCIHFIRNIYKRLAGGSLDNVFDVSEFFNVRAYKFPELNDKSLTAGNYLEKNSLKAVYHDPCHSRHSLNLYSEPRNILKAAGVNLLESFEKGCCGSGGIFGLFYGGISEGILKKRLDSYKDADIIITSCPNCIIHLKSKIKKRRVMHIIEIIDKIVVK